MKSFILLISILFNVNAYSNNLYTIDKTHSSVNFKIRHLFTKTVGQFKSFQGTFFFDPNKISDAKFSFVIDTGSIDTSNDERDKHLRSKDFFWASKYKTIEFKSKKISLIDKSSFEIIGPLSMRGTIREVSIIMRYLGQVKNHKGVLKAGFEAATRLNRKEFGITWNKSLDSGGFILGDIVEIEIFLETLVEPK